MSHKIMTLVLAIAGVAAWSSPSFAFGAIGCTNLPDHDRATATIENGDQSCGMSTAEANRILAQDQRVAAPPATPTPRVHHRRHHKPPQM